MKEYMKFFANSISKSKKEGFLSSQKVVLVLEDDQRSGFLALRECCDVVKFWVETYEDALELLELGVIDLALLDVNIGHREKTGKDIGAICSEKNVPHVYVTGVDAERNNHHTIIAVEIKNSNGDTLERIEANKKEEKIWRRAYELLLQDKG